MGEQRKFFEQDSLCCGFFRCSASPSLSRLTKQLLAAWLTSTMDFFSNLQPFGQILATSILARSLGFTTKATSCGTRLPTLPLLFLSALTLLSSLVISVSNRAATQACSRSTRLTYQPSP